MSCELLTCALTRIHVDFVADEDHPEIPRGEVLTMTFKVEMGKHHADDRQFRLLLAANFSEHTNEKKLGFQVETTIVGFFRVSDDVDSETVVGHAQSHGINTLYGTLRGIVMTATASFPTGPMILKSRTAQQILGIKNIPKSQVVHSAALGVRKRKRQKPAEDGVAAAQRVFAKVLEKADPKAKKR